MFSFLSPCFEHSLAHAHTCTRTRYANLKKKNKGREREDFDEEVTRALEDAGVQLVLCVGYMRILSPGFCRTWAGRCLNVHPSLLPDFAGGMDLQVTMGTYLHTIHTRCSFPH